MPHKEQSRYFFIYMIMAFVAFISIFNIIALKTSSLNLFFDEAQYWDWSKSFEFGYYSKPPMVAWVIAFTTNLCGDSEFCIRLGSPILHLLTAIMIFFAGKKLFSPITGAFCALTYITLPAVSLSSTLISTDPALLFFWSGAFVFFLYALENDKWHYWFLAGVFAGFGMLSKYNMGLFLVSVFFYFFWAQEKRPVFKSAKLWSAILIAFIIFLPNIVWNWQNGFVSFLHTKDNASLETAGFNFSETLEFIGSQFGVFGPILFSTLIAFLAMWKKTIQLPNSKLLLSFILPAFITIIVVSFISRAHANWAAPAYIASTILVVSWLCLINKRKLIQASIVLHITLLFLFANFYAVEKKLGFSLTGKETSFSENKIKDPFLRLKGWQELGEKASEIYNKYPNSFILTDTRKTHVYLLYYSDIPKEKIIKWNPAMTIKDHYDLTTKISEDKNINYILISAHGSQSTENHFSRLHELKPINIDLYDDYKRKYQTYKLSGFKGF